MTVINTKRPEGLSSYKKHNVEFVVYLTKQNEKALGRSQTFFKQIWPAVLAERVALEPGHCEGQVSATSLAPHAQKVFLAVKLGDIYVIQGNVSTSAFVFQTEFYKISGKKIF